MAIENSIDRLLTNVTDALNAIAAKGVDITGMNSDNLAALIAALVKLPTLTTPGAAADLRTGKQLIDGSGNIITGAMPEQAAQTITPGTSDQTIESGRYLTGTQTIAGDSNLVADNIASGKTIFGVAGSYTGGGKSVSGSFTVSTYSSVKHTVTHNLGSIPNFAAVFADTNTITDVSHDYFTFQVYHKGQYWFALNTLGTYDVTLSLANWTREITQSMTYGFGSATTSKITFKAPFIPFDDYLGKMTFYYVLGVI